MAPTEEILGHPFGPQVKGFMKLPLALQSRTLMSHYSTQVSAGRPLDLLKEPAAPQAFLLH